MQFVSDIKKRHLQASDSEIARAVKMGPDLEKRPPPDKRHFAAVLSVLALLSPREWRCNKMPGINTAKNASRVTLLIDIT